MGKDSHGQTNEGAEEHTLQTSKPTKRENADFVSHVRDHSSRIMEVRWEKPFPFLQVKHESFLMFFVFEQMKSRRLKEQEQQQALMIEE